MLQINECLSRLMDGRRPLKQKWQAIRAPQPDCWIYLYHYHHLVLVYDLATRTILHQWWEKPADKRGLDAAKKWLSEYPANQP